MTQFKTGSSLRPDVCVLGGGIVGLSVALGLQRNGLNVSIIDEGDTGLRASRGNFGLVWVQGKGDTLADYAKISRLSAQLWPQFAQELLTKTGINIELQQKGGLFLCLSDDELKQRKTMLTQMQKEASGDYPFEVLDLQQLRDFIPEAGPEVVGATYGPEDGHVNPLFLLRALTECFIKQGGKIHHSGKVCKLSKQGQTFRVETTTENYQCDQIVLAAGLGNKELAPQVGLHAPLTPNRGQVLICERVKPFLHYPTGHVRQTNEGTIQLGDSKEDVGFDTGTSTQVMATIAARASKMFPLLKNIRLIRAWGALRIMTPDGYPIYQASHTHQGAYLVTCHSGVTLGAFHHGPIADWIANDQQDFELEAFHAKRFAI